MGQQVLEELKEIIRNACPETDVSAITGETSVRKDLGIDSLSMMMIIVEIENKFDVQFKNFPYIKTVGDLLELIENTRQY